MQVALVLLALSLPALLLGWPGVPLVAVGFALALRFAPAPLEARPVASPVRLGPASTADERG